MAITSVRTGRSSHSLTNSPSPSARILARIQPSSAVQGARRELAGEFLADLRRIDVRRRDTGKKPGRSPGRTA